MQLSSTARKALAAGLAVSTVVWSMAMFVMPVAFAAPHGNGCLINQSGTIYLVENGVKRGFPSADVYASHGQNFGQVVTANSDDASLPTGPVMVYRDGTLVKGPSDPLVYLVANGQKRGFVSGAVYTGLGYSWANVRTAAVNTFADLPTGANLESATERHTNGIMVKDSTGTIWIMTATGKKGMPSMEVFNSYGYRMSEVVPANAADVAANNEGVLTARVVCADSGTPVVNGAVNVSLASDTPTSTTLVAGQSVADLAHFNFTGNGTVTSLTLKRIGVSGDTTPTNIYLFDGSTRLTDASSVSANSQINFTSQGGLFTVNGSKTISVKADVATSTSGQTLGVQVISGTLSSGTMGGVPVSGNIHTIADATLATVSFSSTVTPSTSDINPANDIMVWQDTATVSTRDVNMTRLALRQTNSINAADIKNFRLVIDGQTVSTVANLDANGYVTFAFNKTLITGSHTIRVLADVVGGSARKITFSLRGTYDVNLADTSYNVGVTPKVDNTTFAALTTGDLSVKEGTISVTKATDSPSGNVTNAASDVTLGKWTMTAYGEPVKIETLKAGFTHVTSGNGAETSTLRNGRLLLNGSQYGNTTTVAPAGTTFTVNYTVNPGTPVTVEFRADVFDNDGTNAMSTGDKITATLVGGNLNNAQGTVSATTVDVPDVSKDANQVIVSEGTISVSRQSNYGDQNTTIPQTAYPLAKFNLVGNSTEDVNLDTIVVKITPVTNATFSSADLNNVYVKYGSNNLPTKATVSATNTWSIYQTLAKNAVVPVEVYGDILSGNITANDSMKVQITISGTTAQSNAAASTATDFDGQTIAYKTGSIASAVDASSPVSKLLDDNSTNSVAAYKFTTTNDAYTITEATFTLAASTSVQNIILKDGSTVLGTLPYGASNVTFSGLNVPVNANSTKILTVDLQMGVVGSGAGATGEAVTVTMTGFKANNSSGVQTVDANSRAGNAMYAFKAVPTITNVSLPTGTLSTGTQTLAKFTINTNGTGTISWKKLIFSVTKTGADATDPAITSPTLWDADTNTQIAGTGTPNTLAAANPSGTIDFVADNEQEISGAKTYVLKASIAATLATGDNINVSIAQPSGHVAPAAYATVAGTTASFVWSDEALVSHSETTLDWNNGYLVKNLPTDSQTLTK